MILDRLAGPELIELIRHGAKNLALHAAEVDRLNVFPVPDGDTGTNMTRTMQGAVSAADGLKDLSDIGKVAASLSRALLMAARGNSGVILSQIFRGITKGLAGHESVTAQELAEAFMLGVDEAYRAVVTPVEGTILTVYREASEQALKSIDEHSSINDYFALHLKQAEKTLQMTTELLPVLKEAGVIDSGGAGWVRIIEGFRAYLEDEATVTDVSSLMTETEVAAPVMSSSKGHQRFAVVTVAQGQGIIDQLKACGADIVIDGSSLMNPSTEDFLRAFKALDAEYIFVLPNDENILLTAKQAAVMHEGAKVKVVPSLTIQQGFGALSLLNYESDDPVKIMEAFNEAIENVVSLHIVQASHDAHFDTASIKEGDWLAIIDGRIALKAPSALETTLGALKDVLDKKMKEVATFIFGKDSREEDDEALLAVIAKTFPDLEIGSFRGEQAVYPLFIALE